MARPASKPAPTERLNRRDSVELGLQFRTAEIEVRAEGDPDERTFEFTFSSEEPYRRYFGDEILGHDHGEVDLSRLNDGGAWLKDHWPTQQIGVVEKAWIADRKGRVQARSGNSVLAKEEAADVRDRIRRKVSVGYIVHSMKLIEESDEGDTYRVTRWEPIEVSNVSIPADVTVGHGKGLDGPLAERLAEFAHHKTIITRDIAAEKGDETMLIKVIRRSDGAEVYIEETDFNEKDFKRSQAPAPNAEVTGGRDEAETAAAKKAVEGERKRVSDILELGAMKNQRKLADEAVRSGQTFDEFRWSLFNRSGPGESYPTLEHNPNEVGLTDKETRRYSLIKAIQASALGDWRGAEFELECSQEIQEKKGVAPSRSARAFYFPADLLAKDVVIDGRRETQAQMRAIASTGSGGNLIGTDHLAGSFIDVLRNSSVAMAMGATYLPGLVGDVSIPRQSASASGGWIAEGASISDADATYAAVTLTPHTVGGKSKLTRKMMKQSSPAVEGLTRADLFQVISLAVDAAVINGAGGVSDEPEGILNMTGIGLLDLGVNGGPMTWDDFVELETLVATANALVGRLGMVTNAPGRGHLRTTPKVSGYPVYLIENNETALGYPLMMSNQVPADLVKAASGATLSAVIFGDWSQELIGEWGSIEVWADPYTDGDEGAVTVRAFADADCAARHEDAFAASVDLVP